MLPKTHSYRAAPDLYGTLLDTASVAKRLAKEYGEEKAEALVALWRRYQREYMWRCSSMSVGGSGVGDQSYDKINHNALDQAACELGLNFTTHYIDALIISYGAMTSFSDVVRAMEMIAEKDHSDIDLCVFTNAPESRALRDMKRSPVLEKYKDLFRYTYSATSKLRGFTTAGYMPHKGAYTDLQLRTSRVRSPCQLWLVSTEPVDIAGAMAVGISTIFVDRAGRGWVDRLYGTKAPSLIVRGVDEAVKAIWEKAEKAREQPK